jgi:hypothetical protein
MSRDKGKGGVHERLTTIVHSIGDEGQAIDNIVDGEWWLDAAQRDKVRKVAGRLIDLVDEYDKLDPLPGAAESPR